MSRELITCPCCGYRTIFEDFDICRICGWEHDLPLVDDPDMTGGANGAVSLRVAQANFAKSGSFNGKSKSTEPPKRSDQRDPDWQPLLQPGDYNALGLRNLVADTNAPLSLRADAVRMLGNLGDVDSVDLLANFLDDGRVAAQGRGYAMAKALIYALGHIADEQARAVIRRLLGEAHYVEFHWLDLLEAVRRQRDALAVPLLVRAAGRPDQYERTLFASTLCQLGTVEAYCGAKEVFDSIDNDGARRSAADEIKRVLAIRSTAPGDERSAMEQLVAHIEPWVRAH